MIKYELIKEYPGSEKLGAIHWYSYEAVIGNDSNEGWKGTEFYDRHPEFWRKAEELDYEILDYRDYNGDLFKYLHNGGAINSVQRLSDGEVFTIGDRYHVLSDAFISDKSYENLGLPIEKFDIINNEINVNQNYLLNLIKKVKKTPLFTTEDGVEIFVGDDFFVVETQFDKYRLHKTIGGHFTKDRSTRLRFYSKEKAEEYVLLNKPCLSLNNLLSVWGPFGDVEDFKTSPLFHSFLELAKSKL